MTTDLGRIRQRTLHTPGHQVSFRVERRTVAVGACLALLLAALFVIALLTGGTDLSAAEVTAAMTGHRDPSGAGYIVWTLRLPRILTAVLVGAALAVSGAVFQQLTRNPLGSPDFLGFSNGAASGAILQILLFGGGHMAIVGGAVAGGAVTSLLVYALAYRNGITGYRLVLVGIGVSAALSSLNSYLLIRAELDEAYRAAIWLTGSLNARTWDHVAVVLLAVSVCSPPAMLLSRRLVLIEMGDDISDALGVARERTRFALIASGVGLVATATAAAGPIAFVALSAPHLARRLTRTSGAGLVTAALMGAVLLLGSDVAVQRLFSTTELPVGLATGALGGTYLTVLLAWRWRRNRR